jgi:nitrogenase molybdenum-iron protein alpha/beta subunit
MTLNPLQSNSCRHGGCTLTGALSATTHVRDSVSIVHGPKGCTHHNFSLLHATGSDNDQFLIPDLVSSALSETDIIFGGEDALERTIESAVVRKPGVVFVLSTCIVDTIGDDVAAVCAREYGIPVIPVPTAGFLGGTFQGGLNNALCAIAGFAGPCRKRLNVNIIGEKNLEYEAEENFLEVSRLLHALDIPVNIRFLRNSDMREIGILGAACLNILRDDELLPTGKFLQARFGTPYIKSFPCGLKGTIQFLESVGETCGVNSSSAVGGEMTIQEETLADFDDISGEKILFENTGATPECLKVAGELAEKLALSIEDHGNPVPLPLSPPVGSVGVRRLLHRWRCAINA